MAELLENSELEILRVEAVMSNLKHYVHICVTGMRRTVQNLKIVGIPEKIRIGYLNTTFQKSLN
jgi:hypothetical protein